MACSGVISAGEHPGLMQERLQSVKQSSSVLGQSAALSYEADLLYRRGCEVGVGLGDPSQYLGKATNVRPQARFRPVRKSLSCMLDREAPNGLGIRQFRRLRVVLTI